MKSKRIEKLRNESLNAINSISAERAILLTEFYSSNESMKVSVPVRRALAFKYILENKKICINKGELIVGERGPAPKATPSYPEICCHSIKDLEILHNREKVSFSSDEKTREAYLKEIIPFWEGKSNREKLIENMSQEWRDAYSAGVFTEFQEQRGPGHTVAGNDIYQKGMLDFKAEIEKAISELDFFSDPLALDKREELKAMDISADAIILFAKRHAEKLELLAENESDKTRRNELQEMSEICSRVPANAPKTFHEALQHYWFIHLGVVTELNPWDSFNPGRLDRNLFPFYTNDCNSGLLTKDKSIELLQSFWIKFNNQPAPPKVGVTALESNTYTDFSLINLGGVNEDGTDAVNELSYIILDVIEEMRLLQPSSMVQVSKKNPDSFIDRAIKISKTGFGQPSIFNSDALIQEMLNQGKSIKDARNGGASGCVETGAFGTEAYILTGYFNLPKILELTLNNGFDNRTNSQLGPKTGEAVGFKSFHELMTAFEKQLNHFIDIKIEGNNIIERLFAQNLPVPFLSLIIEDCIKNGKDYLAGGARYNSSYIQGVGLGSITDSFTALKTLVFDKQQISMEKMLLALKNDFCGFEELRAELIFDTPKWGNDNDIADIHAKEVFEIFYEAVNGRPTARGGVHRINMLPTTCHVYFGTVINALPDGRKAGTPLSEGISPVQGADICGPTAVIKSASKIDHLRTGGTLLNQKFSPSFFKSDNEIRKVSQLVRSYFRMDGHHIQFNVVSVDTLKDAQKNPEKYRDLIVRVAGYSDYFNDLGEDLQNEIINRTEHKDLC